MRYTTSRLVILFYANKKFTFTTKTNGGDPLNESPPYQIALLQSSHHLSDESLHLRLMSLNALQQFELSL